MLRLWSQKLILHFKSAVIIPAWHNSKIICQIFHYFSSCLLKETALQCYMRNLPTKVYKRRKNRNLIKRIQVRIDVISIIGVCWIELVCPLSRLGHVLGWTPFRFTFIVYNVKTHNLCSKQSLIFRYLPQRKSSIALIDVYSRCQFICIFCPIKRYSRNLKKL